MGENAMAVKLETVLNRFRSITDEKDFRLSFLHHLHFTRGKDWGTATREDKYAALALAVRDRVAHHLIATQQTYADQDVKRVYYFSLEFLIGRMLLTNLVNLQVMPLVREALQNVECDLDDLAEVERDAALGNGGLGRLAACFIESLASLGFPAYGYGILYEYGLFRQEIRAGHQRERPDYWLDSGRHWLLDRPEHTVVIPVGGRVEHGKDRTGDYNPMWLDWRVILGEPCDIPVVGYGGQTVNLLRLFRAKASADFDVEIFNSGDYVEAIRQKIYSENISKILYPQDASESGRELRLLQEYFLVACGVRDIMRRYRRQHTTWNEFADKVAIQLNDTHPALAVAELQRFFVDEAGLSWDRAWDLVRGTLGYTNHTLMPEALETWPVRLLENLLPRHMQIIYELNHRFLAQVRTQRPGDDALLERVSMVGEVPEKQVRMAHLAVVGSHTVNGVAKLHTELLRQSVLKDFAELMPGKIISITNGITHRRWLLAANPELAALLTRRLGDSWILNLEYLRELAAWQDDPELHAELRAVKLTRKQALLKTLGDLPTSGAIPTEALYDVQAKRLHEYKRQLLNALQVASRYLQLLETPGADLPPRVIWFAAKAAPGYGPAKLIIKFINNLGAVINRDRRTRDRLQLYFLPDYRVTQAETLLPAADLSEQISLAGTEASGTGNMKLALNGALTIGTLDGATVEIRDAVGHANLFDFGMTTPQVAELRREGYYPRDWIRRSPALEQVLAAIRDNRFSPREHGIFTPMLQSLTEHDTFMVCADFEAYVAAQRNVDEIYFRQPAEWSRRVVMNIANMGYFSSDRAVREYAAQVWGVVPVKTPDAPQRV